MLVSSLLLFAGAVLASPAPSNNMDGMKLFATHYSGTLSTLTLAKSNTGGYTLTKTSSIEACGSAPSWLTLDDCRNTLYCSSEDEPGSLSAFSINPDGSLQQKAVISTIGADVYSNQYGGKDGKGFIAIAHYNGYLSTYRLPITADASPLQTFNYTLLPAGPVEGRQDSSHVHQAITDPTGRFLIAPDLGADVLHVFSIDVASGLLKPLQDVKVAAGNGPRHVAFKQLSTKTFMFLANEISNKITTFELDYCENTNLKFKQIDNKYTFPAVTPPEIAVAEIRVVDSNIYVTNRNMSDPPAIDSITRFTIDQSSGVPRYAEQTSSYGSYPRTLAISKDKTLVAVGDQKSQSVVIVQRDVSTGRLGKELAALQVEATEEGLSSVIFAD